MFDLQSPNIASQTRDAKMEKYANHNGHHSHHNSNPSNPMHLELDSKAPNVTLNGNVSALLANHIDDHSDPESPLATAVPNGMMPNSFQMDQLDEHEDADLAPSPIITNNGRRHSLEADSDVELPSNHDQPSC